MVRSVSPWQRRAPQLVCLDILRHDRIAGKRRGHVLTEHRGRGRRAAGVGNVGHCDVRCAGECRKAHLERRARTYGRHRQLAGLGARGVEHVLERLIGRRAVDHEHRRRLHQVADRIEGGHRMVVRLSRLSVDQIGVGGHQQRVAVRRRTRDRLGPDHSAGARPVFDDDRHALRPADLLGHQASHSIGAGARRHWHDQVDGPARLRPRALAGQRQHDDGATSREHILDPGDETPQSISGPPACDIGAIRARLRHAHEKIGGRLFLLQQESALFSDRGHDPLR